jgi:hypothetical protein
MQRKNEIIFVHNTPEEHLCLGGEFFFNISQYRRVQNMVEKYKKNDTLFS